MKAKSASRRPARGTKHILRLYIAGQNTKSREALKNLKEICEWDFPGEYKIEIVDVRKNPGAAQENNLIALPAVFRTSHPTRSHSQVHWNLRRQGREPRSRRFSGGSIVVSRVNNSTTLPASSRIVFSTRISRFSGWPSTTICAFSGWLHVPLFRAVPSFNVPYGTRYSGL
jgi:KaiB domain